MKCLFRFRSAPSLCALFALCAFSATSVFRLAPVAATLLLAACEEPEPVRLEKIYTASATSVATAQSQITAQWTADELRIMSALGMAHDRLDEKPNANSVAFALAVLGAIAELEGPITRKSDVNEFFWMRTGTLAGKAAAVAMRLNDVPTATAAVLAGPRRWQNDAYWMQNPAHDALVSYLLHMNGKTGEALARLRDRPEMAPEVQRAYEQIQGAK